TQEGTIKVKGQKYNIDISDYQIISDGETLWTYEKETNTCYADYVEDVADGSFSPSEMFTIWEQDFKHELKGTVMEGGKKLHHINLYPNDPADKPYHTIQLYVSHDKLEVTKITVKGREGNDMIYDVKSFRTNTDISEKDFTFSEANYPGVDLIDQRI
ncbi:MAG: outer membrane lipoprotein carrier protein LolA, partial [Flavobacteriales bacterium]|nr:outer membrane lipoprotein carrier protein LolA [Flavobacteriales bacterium]